MLKKATSFLICSNLLFALSFITDAQTTSQLPFTFKSGAPAKANQVNANFDYLRDEIEKSNSEIAQNASTLSEALQCSKNSNDSNEYTFKYEPKSLAIGEAITFDEHHHFRMVAIPFVDFATSTKYRIKMPVLLRDDNYSDSQYLSTTLSMHAYTEFDECFNDEIGGYAAKIVGSEHVNYLSFSEVTYGDGGILLTTNNNTYNYIYVLVGKTVIDIRVENIRDVVTTDVVAQQFNLTEDFDYKRLEQHHSLNGLTDDYIDYIVIEKVEE